MRAYRTFPWLKRIALLLVFVVSTGSALTAQTSSAGEATLASTLTPGTTAWITDAGGHEQKTRIVSLSGEIVTATVGDDIRRLRTTDIERVRVRQSDSVIDGALIGAGAAVASGLFLCRLTEPWENCRQAGPIVRIGAVGAGVGIAIDALIRGRTTVYDASRTSLRLEATPLVDADTRGLQLSLRF